MNQRRTVPISEHPDYYRVMSVDLSHTEHLALESAAKAAGMEPSALLARAMVSALDDLERSRIGTI